ncbi:putative short chain type dehydrogenase [Fusarium flagelliforme]|uniref:Putative short chain type dehydrogenase n=2 Tax=Fusarium flagelliforme TaxID=2675880 RepID=A0A395M9A6_9HYPO|nr:putative short chain type dehydrogenase [Fusarium flagelliforme]
MAAKSPVILILGYGANIGKSVANKFSSQGYKVAVAARSVKEDNTDSFLNIPSDFSKTESITNAFEQVKQKFGVPSVVVYNASAANFSPKDEPFDLSLEDLNENMTVNIRSPFIAFQQAVAGFKELPDSASRTFIYTGNILNVSMIPGFLAAGIGKSGAAYMTWTASEAYKSRGFKFYYADERKPDGGPIYRVNGDAHGDLYWELSQGKEQGPWMQSFVKGIGYKAFDTIYES